VIAPEKLNVDPHKV